MATKLKYTVEEEQNSTMSNFDNQSDLDELYQDIIIEHNQNPQNKGYIPDSTHSAEGFNPFCGDTIKIYLLVQENIITDIKFSGSGCAISQASTSMMTDQLKNMTLEQAKEVFEEFHTMVTNDTGVIEEIPILGDLQSLAGVSAYPTRIKCAILGWHTLSSAIEEKKRTVTTE